MRMSRDCEEKKEKGKEKAEEILVLSPPPSPRIFGKDITIIYDGVGRQRFFFLINIVTLYCGSTTSYQRKRERERASTKAIEKRADRFIWDRKKRRTRKKRRRKIVTPRRMGRRAL